MALLELRVRLNASEVVSSFAGDVRSPVAQLAALELPLDGSAVQQLAASAGRIDLTALANAAERIAERLTGRDLQIPDPAQAVAGLRAVVALVEELDPRQLEVTIRAAIELAAAELRQPRTGRFDVMAERLAGVLSASPEGQRVAALLARLVALAGADAVILDELKALLPAALGVIRALGGILRVETALSEAERLTRTMQAQADAEATSLELAAVRTALEHAAERLAAAAGDAALEVEAERATLAALERIDVARAGVARRLAFAESTLLYADLANVTNEARLGLEEAQQVDLRAAGDAIGKVVGRLLPVLSLPLPPAPADSFGALLSLIEAQVQEIARRIEAVDVARAAAPVAELGAALTRPVRELERLGTELTTGARGAIEGVTDLVSSLPTGELTTAVQAATAPVRDALAQITALIAAIETQLTAVASTATSALGAAEQAVDALVGALEGVVQAAAAFVEQLNLDAAMGALDEQLGTLRTALEQASVRPYFSAAVDAIDTTASVLENVPVVLLPEDIKAEFDALVEPIRSLNVEAVAGEVESWFALEEGRFPFEAELEQTLGEIREQLAAVMAAVEPHHPRLLAQSIDAELAPLRAQLARLDIAQALAPLEQAIATVQTALDRVDPAETLRPVSAAMTELAGKLDAYRPGALLEPLQQQIVAAREAVIEATRLEAASQALADLEREAVRLITRVDPVLLEPEIAAALAAARQELARLDALSFGEWVGPLLTAMLSGDGARRRPATWNTVLAWLVGAEATSALRGRAEHVVAAVTETSAGVRALELDATTTAVTSGLARLRSAVQQFPAGAPLRVRLEEPIRRRGTDGGFIALGVNHARFRAELEAGVAAAGGLLPLELARVDLAGAALRAAAAPVVQLRGQLLGMLRQVGIQRPGDGLGAILGEVLDVLTPERASAILVPIYTALRGRAEALLGGILGPLRAAIDDLLGLLRLLDLTQLTQGLDEIVEAGKQQVLALDPLTVLAPTLTAFEALRVEVRSFDPLAPVREVVDALRETAQRILDKLSVERLIEPASQVFDQLLETVRGLDPDALVLPLVESLRTLATDIHDGLVQLRAALVRLQEAIPSTEGLALAGVGDVDVDVDLGF